jgi:radical SAM superfamily enzyme YgiQ (UPF0313 family)
MNIAVCTLHLRRSLQSVPLAAGCLVAALPKSLRRSAFLVDAFPDQSDDHILSAILEGDPHIVAFPIYVWNRNRIVSLAKKLHLVRSSLILIAGGPEVTGDPDGIKDEAPWSALVKGEGEAIFSDLISAYAENFQLQCDSLPDSNTVQGKILHEQTLPLEIQKATSPWLSEVLEPGYEVLWEVARGCSFSCDYCFEARDKGGTRPIPQARLEEELELFVRKGVNQVWVLDSTFNYPPERGIALLELLLRKASGLHYHFEAKFVFLDKHTVKLLGQLNCSVQIGLQSIHEQALLAIHRSIDLELLPKKTHLLSAEGITYGIDLIYGLPKDNLDGFFASVDCAFRLAPNHMDMFPLAVLPGSRLAEKVTHYGLRATPSPPYELISSTDWSPEDLARSRELAAATELFYNTGRAVAFFLALLDVLRTPPSEFLLTFFRWAQLQPDISADKLLATEQWTAHEVYQMQKDFLSLQLKQSGKDHLVSLVLDLLCYHYYYAETLLGEELMPLAEPPLSTRDFWETPVACSDKIHLIPFAYEILDLLEMGDIELNEMATLFRPVGSVALFFRRNNQVFCESLGEDMLRLLQHSDGRTSPKDIFSGSLPAAMGRELVEFAACEGLIVPVYQSKTI